MTQQEQLHDTLRRSFDGHAWHGPSVQEAIADVTAEEASWRAAASVHSIWELTLHIAAWANEVARRLQGEQPGEPKEGDWPPPGSMLDGDAWQDAVQRVFSARDRVLGVIRDLNADDLAKLCGTTPSAPPGTGVTYAALIEGLAQHNAYHGGQIVLLKKLARAVV